MSRRITGIAFGALGALVLGPATSASAWCRTTTSETKPSTPTECITEGTPLFWARRCQSFSVDTRSGGGLTLAGFRSIVGASFAQWNAVDCGNGPSFSVTQGMDVVCDQDEYSSNDENSNTIAFTGDFVARMYPNDAIAITVVWHDTRNGQIYDADMMINASMGPFVNCPDAGCPVATTSFDLRNVITHEAGHFLGLSHSADAESTMYYRADPGETKKRTLGADDVAGFCAIYGGAAVPAECDTTPRHGFDADCTGETPSTNSGDGGCGCTTGGASSAAAPTSSAAAFAFAALALSRLRARRRRTRGS